MNAEQTEHKADPAASPLPDGRAPGGPHPKAGKAKAAPWVPPPLFWLNVVLWLLAGVLFSGWLLHYTDKFEVFGGLLALGGAASWLAFALKVLPEDRLEILQVQFCDKFFVRRRSTWVALAWLALTVFLFLTRGSIQVESYQQIGGDVWIYATGETSDSIDPVPLQPGARLRLTRWAPLWSTTSYDVRVSGLPATTVSILPGRRRATVQVPYSYRPVVLVGVNYAALEIIQEGLKREQKYRMVVTVDGKDYPVDNYAGDVVLIGSSLPMDVPPHVRINWADELKNPKLAAKLLSPRLLKGCTELRPRGSVVSISVFENQQDTEMFGAGPLAVQPVLTIQDVVQPLLVE